MADIIEDIKSIYTGENAFRRHLIFASILVAYTILSNIFGKYSFPIDFIFQIFLTGYLVLYLTNILHKNDSTMPDIKEIQPEKAFKAFGLWILWTLYLIIPLIIIGLILYIPTSIFINEENFLPLLIGIPVFIFACPFLMLSTLIIIAYADKFSAKKLLNIKLLAKLIPAYGSVFGVFIQYMGLMLAIFLPIGLILGSLSAMAAKETLALYIMLPVFLLAMIPALYLFEVISMFCIPKSLTQTYYNNIKPVFENEIELIEETNQQP